jgi:hypothetical protein
MQFANLPFEDHFFADLIKSSANPQTHHNFLENIDLIKMLSLKFKLKK